MADDPYKYFRIEARELIEHIQKAALELEKQPRPETIALILRHAHTLKGAARVVRQAAIADRAHAIEDRLAPVRDNTRVTAEHVRGVLALVDEIQGHVAALAVPGEPAAPTRAPRTIDEPAPIVVRAELVDMDALLDGIVETSTRVEALRASAESLERVRQLAELLAVRPRGERDIEKRQIVIDQLREEIRRSQRDLQVGIESASRELVEVREAAERLRLVAAGSLFPMLERAARDAADATGKRVTFEARGGDVRLDAHVLATMQGALIQLVRNAVAHGIEVERERLAANKPAAGRLVIEIVRRGRKAVFACRDDGRGVDLAAVRRAAARRGISLPETADAAELVAVLLGGGISTSLQVDEVAGRGIGLDVVRAAVEKLGGAVRVETAAMTGTTFELTVPVSLASIDALGAEVAGIGIAVPLDVVRTARRVGEAEVSRTPQGELLVYEDATVPFLPLATVLSGASAAPSDPRTVRVAIVLEANGRRAAIGVDRLLGTTATVVRPIPDVASIDPIVAGAALDARGTPRLVLDPVEVIAAAHRERTMPAVEPRKPVSVLVIDDSLTTRTLEQSILELAGYDVDTATSGEQGLDAARRKRYALFLVDVEMPGIDGFTFVERVRGDPALRDIPAILVTSRSSPEDRRRGEQVGAQGYIVKSEFDQVDLLARIQRLVRSHG